MLKMDARLSSSHPAVHSHLQLRRLPAHSQLALGSKDTTVVNTMGLCEIFRVCLLISAKLWVHLLLHLGEGRAATS